MKRQYNTLTNVKYSKNLKWDLVGSLRLVYQLALRLKLLGSERTDP